MVVRCDKKKRLTFQCPCGDVQQPEVLPPNSVQSIPESSGASNDESGGEEFVETKKGQPGSSATFPNGLRDVHEMSATIASKEEDPLRSAERSGECIFPDNHTYYQKRVAIAVCIEERLTFCSTKITQPLQLSIYRYLQMLWT